MRKNVFGRRFKRDANERKALFKSLMSSLVIYGKIKTTESKAKAIKGHIEKLVTKAKKGNLIVNTFQEFLTPQSATKLIREVAPTFQNRPGGYTRMVRLGRRFSDNASEVVLEWVEGIKAQPAKIEKSRQKVEKVVAVKKSQTQTKRGRPSKESKK